MTKPTLAEFDTEVRDLLGEIKTIHQSGFAYKREREESVIFYTLFQLGQEWCKFEIREDNGDVDLVWPDHPMLFGDPTIIEFLKKLQAWEWKKASTDVVQVDAAKTEKPNALQTKWDKMSDKTKERFRQAWKIWNRMRKEYRQESIDGKTKEAQPTIKDWQTKVKKDLHWDVSESRLRDVKEMGESKTIK